MDASLYRTITVVAAVAVFGVLVVGGTTGSEAGDTSSVFAYEPENATVAQGETVTVTVTAYADRGPGGIGVDHVNLTALYDADVLTLTAVEAGGWLDGEDASVEMDTVEREGAVTIRQTRSPAGDGVFGTGRFAALTFEAEEDASLDEYSLNFSKHADVQMVNDHYQPVFVNNGTVAVTASDGAEETGPGFGISSVLAAVALVAVCLWVRCHRT